MLLDDGDEPVELNSEETIELELIDGIDVLADSPTEDEIDKETPETCDEPLEEIENCDMETDVDSTVADPAEDPFLGSTDTESDSADPCPLLVPIDENCAAALPLTTEELEDDASTDVIAEEGANTVDAPTELAPEETVALLTTFIGDVPIDDATELAVELLFDKATEFPEILYEEATTYWESACAVETLLLVDAEP